jgi:uncharacterized protein YdhG (YjbR/CyaY superfamily)
MGRLVDRPVALELKQFETVDEYIAAQDKPARTALKRVRAAIRKAIPRATETISYGMPTYKLGSARVLHFAAWSRHFSIYGATRGVVASLKEQLTNYKMEKGTIRFPLSEPVPVGLIERIAKLRGQEVSRRAAREK